MEGKLKIKNYIGYASCDVGGMLAFSVMGSYLTVYATDILKISAAAISIIMIIARIWDGINDPIMGFLVQSRKPTKSGKYRPFLLMGGIPLAISSVLVFTKIPGLTTAGYTAYIAVAYIVYGMLYTVVLVPYGSLASVMTLDSKERSTLSMFRSIGGGIGSIPCAILFPVVVLTAGENHNQLDESRLFVAMCIIAVIMIAMYIISFKCTKEVYVPEETPHKINIFSTVKELCKNRSFVIMSFVGCLLMAASMYMNTVNIYIFKDCYNQKGIMLTMLTVISYAPMVLMIPFTNKLIKRFGKKELSVAGLIVSTLAAFMTWILKIDNPYIFMAFALFINAGIGFLTLEVWAMAADVIDSQELRTHKREEAADYAIFTFMRKIGQAIAALAPMFLGLAGYDTSLAGTGKQNAQTLEGMYNYATLVPFIILALMLVLMIAYPLNKKGMNKMQAELEELRFENAGEKNV